MQGISPRDQVWTKPIKIYYDSPSCSANDQENFGDQCNKKPIVPSLSDYDSKCSLSNSQFFLNQHRLDYKSFTPDKNKDNGIKTKFTNKKGCPPKKVKNSLG